MSNEPVTKKIRYLYNETTKDSMITEGSLELTDSEILFYKKSTAVRVMFGLVGSLLEGKGKQDFSIRYDDIQDIEYVDEKHKQYRIITKSGDSYRFNTKRDEEFFRTLSETVLR